MSPPRLLPIAGIYLFAFAAILVFSIVALSFVHVLLPELPQEQLVESFPGLLAGAAAASSALIFTLLLCARPLDRVSLRLAPGTENGRQLLIMVAGMLALSQTLDSLTVITGVANRGNIPLIRRALEGVSGPDLLAAVVVIGLAAGMAEEVFFRGWMLTRLLARWPAVPAIVASSAAFAALHLEWVHTALAFAMGLYLGFITARSGSALPAIVCHVINNAESTFLIATIGSVDGLRQNLVLAGGTGLVFLVCVAWLARSLRPAPPPVFVAR
ncbi:MAG: CPBP family intramembrane metalloprotease [Candidatus Rokubacteria bacterium]|nr:CPBP family intramembrane metalloprotease [Candidatus Rokubacteria bacterium]